MILVTGGTGLIGSHLLFELASQGNRIRALRRSASDMNVFRRTFRRDPARAEQVEWVEGDINDLFSLADALRDIREVYHAAGLISFVPSDFNKLMKVNVEGTANLVNVCLEHRVGRFCHISSVAALGRSAGVSAIDEDSVWKTSSKNSVYAISKYGAEREVWRGMEEGLPAVIVNPSIVIGAGDWNSGSSRLISQVWKGMRFYTEGTAGYVDVRDVARCAAGLMSKQVSGQRYILNAENLSYHLLFDTIAEMLGKKKPGVRVKPWMTGLAWRVEAIRGRVAGKPSVITRETARNSHDQWFYSNDKIRKELGVEFLPVRKSIEDACRIFLEERSAGIPV